MRRIIFILAILLSVNVNAQFTIDMSHTKALSEFDVLTINDLGIAESGYIYIRSNICIIGKNNIGIDKYTKLEPDRSEYMSYMKVTRKPNGIISLFIEDKEPKVIAGVKLPGGGGKVEALKSLVLSITKATTCKSEVFVIDTIDDTKGVTELVELIKKKIVETGDYHEQDATSVTSRSEPEWTWMVSEDKSKIDDSDNVTLMLFSNEKVYNVFGGSDRPTFVIRCKENKTDAYITTGRMLDDDKATIRLGNEKAYTLNMSKSTDGKALFFPSAISNIKKIGGYKEMVFRYTPYNSGNQTVTFNIAGLMNEIKPLRKACHW